jgi:hypothetical protein
MAHITLNGREIELGERYDDVRGHLYYVPAQNVHGPTGMVYSIECQPTFRSVEAAQNWAAFVTDLEAEGQAILAAEREA